MNERNDDYLFYEFAKSSLRLAIKHCGTQERLGEAIGVTGEMVNYLLNQAEAISSKYAILIEKATHKKVSRFDLSLEARELYDAEIDLDNEKIEPTIMDRVRKGIQLEKEMNYRKGRPKSEINPVNLPDLKGDTREWMAKRVGLGSGKNYEKAKFIYYRAIYPLRKLVDSKHFSIDLAFKIAQLKIENQQNFLSLNKRQAIKKLKEPEFIIS